MGILIGSLIASMLGCVERIIAGVEQSTTSSVGWSYDPLLFSVVFDLIVRVDWFTIASLDQLALKLSHFSDEFTR